jgi:hypothetical protein
MAIHHVRKEPSHISACALASGRGNAITAGWCGGLCGGLRGLLSTSGAGIWEQVRSNSKSLKSLKITQNHHLIIIKIFKIHNRSSLAFVFEETHLTVEDKSDKSSRAFRISKLWFCLRMMGKTSQMVHRHFPDNKHGYTLGVYTIF